MVIRAAMMFIACCYLSFTAKQLVVITHYSASLCLAENKQHRTLNPFRPGFLGLKMHIL